MTRAAVLLLLAASLAPGAEPANLADLKAAFLKPPDDARIMMRWWWFGSAVTRTEIERELRRMKEGGIGGVEIQAVYPIALDDPSKGFTNLPFLSPEFLDAIGFAAGKARELGMRVDLTIGSGWPYGGPHTPVTEAAGRLRAQRVAVSSRRVPVPGIGHGESLIAAFDDANHEVPAPRDGIVWLPAGEATREVTFFIASRTGMMVKRPAVGAEGFVLDHYDRRAIDHYLEKVGAPLIKALAANPPYAAFCDSLEVFGSDWTTDFLEEFQRRRGYDLKPNLPALVREIGPKTAAIRHDWGRTLTELLEDRFITPMRQWAKANGTLFRIQGYGIPPATISTNALVDLPEGEGPQWKVVRASRWASSASHLYGKPVTSSETWTWLHSPAFRATPLDIKAEADLHFLQGINQLIGHGWPYNPEGIAYPGARFYAAAALNDRNPWWIVMPDLALYLQRTSFLMRQGAPVNDVALYLPNSDAWSRFTTGRVHMIETLREMVGETVMPQILESGYGLDFIDDGALDKAVRVEEGGLVSGASRYRAVVLPGVETIPVTSMRKLEHFVRAGGILIATRRTPTSAPGLTATEPEDADVKAISKRLFSGQAAPAKLVRDDAELGAALRTALTPGLALEPAVTDVGFVHRSTPFAEIYFVANTSNQVRSVKAAFRAAGPSAEAWNPLDGSMEPVQVLSKDSKRVSLALTLQPYESRVFVFSNSAAASPVQWTPNGAARDISGGWTVRFPNTEPRALDRPRSWTGDDDTRYFSGTARYERSFDLATVPEGRVLLDFGPGSALKEQPLRNGMRAWYEGPIREAAVVTVNGARAGALFAPPYALDIAPHLRAGANRIEVEVGNTALNHMAGHSLPDYRLLNLRYGVRFEPQDMDKVQALPSGITGPVQLRVLSRKVR